MFLIFIISSCVRPSKKEILSPDGSKVAGLNVRTIENERQMIKLDTIGRILKGDQAGWYVKIQHDEKSGGYYIFQFKNKDVKNYLGEAFDDWLESMADVENYAIESSWDIEWLN